MRETVIYRHLRAAYGFLLRAPVPHDSAEAGAPPSVPVLTAEALWACIPIGVLMGASAAILAAAVQMAGLPDRLAAWAVIGFMALISGALHEDGLADVIDGFFGGKNPEERLKIMKTPNIGVFAVLALIVLKSAEAELLTVILRHEGGLFFIAVLAGISRGYWSMALRLSQSLPSGKASLAYKLGNIGTTHLLISLSLSGALAVLALPLLTAVILWAGLSALCFAWVRFCRYKIGGITGDCLGALQQLGFLAGLIIYVMTEVL